MPEENETEVIDDLSTPPEGGEETPPSEDGEGGEPETPEKKAEAEVVSVEEHQKLQGRLAYAERELRRKEREPPAKEREPDPPAAEVALPDKPKPDDFEEYDDFVEALTDWKTDRKLDKWQRDSQANDQQKSAAQQRIDRDKKVDGIVAAELVKDPDFQKKAYIPVGMEDLVADSDQFVEIAFYFGKNPDEAMRIVDLPPLQAAREIGRIEAELQNKIPQRTQTKAPVPTRTVGGRETVEKTLDDMTTEEHIAFKNKQEFG